MDLDPALNTPESDELEVLSIIVEADENEQYPPEKPDPIEAIRFRIEQAGLTVADMRPYIGPLNRVYEALNRTRPLTLTMIRKLHEGLKIPADVLIGAAA
ncbi:MAG TPA: transcriptional regulator [Paraburkholderia sp.]